MRLSLFIMLLALPMLAQQPDLEGESKKCAAGYVEVPSANHYWIYANANNPCVHTQESTEIRWAILRRQFEDQQRKNKQLEAAIAALIDKLAEAASEIKKLRAAVEVKR